MASPSDSISMAVFCDFENVALGVRDAQYEKFDIKPVLERLLLKGSIVVKKAYCDWERYKGFKATMHESNFELIEIPHVRQSGKNSADIRLVVDALDLCYTKSHVNTFVIISGDSDFSPLVSKLRENAKQVIGVGVKQSTSDLLIANCDEFIFYDDLVREKQRALARRQSPGANAAPRRTPEEERQRRETQDVRRTQGVELAVETFEDLMSERGDSGKIWASVLKEAIKRRKPDFSESYYGFRTFGNLLEEAQSRGMLEFGRDEKSGAYVYRSLGHAALPGDALGERAGAAAPAHPRLETHAARPLADSPARSSEASPRGGRGRGRQEGRGTRPSEEQPEATTTEWVERPRGSYFGQQPAAMPAPESAAAPLPLTDVAPLMEAAAPVPDEVVQPAGAENDAPAEPAAEETTAATPRKPAPRRRTAASGSARATRTTTGRAAKSSRAADVAADGAAPVSEAAAEGSETPAPKTAKSGAARARKPRAKGASDE